MAWAKTDTLPLPLDVFPMSDEPKDKEEGIFRLDTVPPPDGGTAYDAPTRVGPMPESVLDAMKKAALEGTALKPPTLPRPAKTPSVEELTDADVQSGDVAQVTAEAAAKIVETPAAAETPLAPPLAPALAAEPAPPQPVASRPPLRAPFGPVALPPPEPDVAPVPKWAVVVIGVSLVVALVSVLALIFRST